jgi:hypothetical protein
MKNSTLSLEGLLLLCLLLIGLYGAKTMLRGEEASPEVAAPRQESPAMVLVPTTDNTTYDGYY